MMGEDNKIPLTVIGGFLGAGKTTLMNRILTTATRRYAVLVNDFGALNIDASLIRSDDGLKMELDNGCICCSLSLGFAETMLEILALDPPPEAVLVEASGVGDPWRIAEIALAEPKLCLEWVIALVDAVQFSRQMRDPLISDTLAKQIKRADLIILNKVDIAEAFEKTAALKAIAATNDHAAVIETVNAALPEDLFSGEALVPVRSNHAHAEVHDHAHHHEHEDIFARWNIAAGADLTKARLASALDALPSSILRLKGWVGVADAAYPCLVQYVAGRFSIEEDQGAPTGRGLVAIGLPGASAETAMNSFSGSLSGLPQMQAS